jgi:hypothetical protein
LKSNIKFLILWTFILWTSCAPQIESPAVTKPDPRILAIGNSITWHPPSAEIGWSGNWGMAASAADKDYFSLLENLIRSKKPEAVLMRENVFPFERGFESFDFTFYDHLKDFEPDILIIRFGENIDSETIEGNMLANSIKDFVDFLADGREMQILVTTTFWPNEIVNQQLILSAETNNWELVRLSDLGSLEENMAIGLFSNEAVARHPGDLGMERIAVRIFNVLKRLL